MTSVRTRVCVCVVCTYTTYLPSCTWLCSSSRFSVPSWTGVCLFLDPDLTAGSFAPGQPLDEHAREGFRECCHGHQLGSWVNTGQLSSLGLDAAACPGQPR